MNSNRIPTKTLHQLTNEYQQNKKISIYFSLSPKNSTQLRIYSIQTPLITLKLCH